MKKVLLSLLGVGIFIAAIGILTNRSQNGRFNLTKPSPTPERKEISVSGEKLQVEVVEKEQERRRGLSNRESLAEGTGMLFVFDENSRPTFWMKEMNFAIDIIWIDNGEIVSLNKNVQPEPDKEESDLSLYPAPQEIDYVLEVNSGYSNSLNLQQGDTVDINLD